ncbi:MAG: hypothetical protein ACXU9A_19270, partial [Xanthobacteraceae bacterium]
RFPVRPNLGQWLRWEAAFEEIRSYYSVPDQFRRLTLATFGEGVERIIASSRSLRLLPLQRETEHGSADNEELAQPTIFPFVIRHEGRVFSLDECRTIHRALSRNATRDGCDQEIAAKICLVG